MEYEAGTPVAAKYFKQKNLIEYYRLNYKAMPFAEKYYHMPR